MIWRIKKEVYSCKEPRLSEKDCVNSVHIIVSKVSSFVGNPVYFFPEIHFYLFNFS